MKLTGVPVQARIKKIYDHLYANADVKTPHAIAYEFGKLGHVCLYIESVRSKVPAFEYSHKDAAALLRGGTLLSKEISTYVRAEFDAMRLDWSLYRDDDSIRLSDFDISYCCVLLSGLVFTDRKTDLIGDIFEIIRSQFAKEKGGQFFTDPQVTHLAMNLLEFDPFEGDDLVDLCAGTGGFLLAGMAHLEERIASEERNPDELPSLLRRAFIGLEIDPDASAAANGTIAARFGRSADEIVQTGDSLGDLKSLSPSRIQPGLHRCAATNPPFGTKITIKDPAILGRFELARLSSRGGHVSSAVYPQAPDTLFLEQNLNLIAPEIGRLAIVVPYQLTSGPRALPIRSWLLRNAKVLCVIDLPADTFQPHTGTKGCLLILSRRARPLRDPEEASDESIFMGAPVHIGHDRRGNAIYQRLPDGSMSPELLSDIPAVQEAFRHYRAGGDPEEVHDRCFAVQVKDVLKSTLQNLNAAYHLRTMGSDSAQPSLTRAGRLTYKRLGDVTSQIFCPARFKRHYVGPHDGGVRFLGGSNITEFLNSSAKWLDKDDPKIESLNVRPGWILVTRSGSTGIVSTVPEPWGNCAMSEHVIRIIPNDDIAPGGYIYAVLASSYGQSYMKKGVFGSVIDEISTEYLADMPIPFPEDLRIIQDIGASMAEAEARRSSAMNLFGSAVASVEEALGLHRAHSLVDDL